MKKTFAMLILFVIFALSFQQAYAKCNCITQDVIECETKCECKLGLLICKKTFESTTCLSNANGPACQDTTCINGLGNSTGEAPRTDTVLFC
ncbi:hypothetical protein RCL_jg3279.t1 [Rhizophagus clarus]|uniref:Extracellular membrane protein CFEM domain-containing protein n=1 Tax=Rhizophagus clarus TaxID=94130 RepID=A0A8H3M7U8_9GLOM|nr:hypothetical protein RCL_jg3279.t1 [Rhizophagus clarus]